MADTPPPQRFARARALLPHDRSALLWLALGAGLVLRGAALRVPGWNPPSLFLDDQWVGIVATRMGWSDYFSLHPPVPAGFALALAVLARVFHDPEWSLQLLPVACSVAVIPLAGGLVHRLTGRPALAVLASAALVADPRLSTFAMRAKPYAVDCLLAVALALLASWATSGGRRRPVALAAAVVIAGLFSFPALLVGGALVGALALLDRGARDRAPWSAAAIATFAAGTLAHYFLLVSRATHDSLEEYWEGYFLPLPGQGDVSAFLADRGVAFLTGPFPRSIEWAALLVVPGVAVLLRRPATRWAGAAALLTFGGALLASALQRYPFGGARTDLYAHGIVVSLACAALSPLVSSRPSHWTSVTVAIAAVALAAFGARPGRYPPREDARLVREAHATLRPGDALVLHPAAGLAAGYYWPGPVRLRPDPRGCGFNAEMAIPGAVTLARGTPGRRPPAIVEVLPPVLERSPERVVYLATNVSGRADERVRQAIVEAGYEVESVDRGPVAGLTVFRRVGSGASPP